MKIMKKLISFMMIILMMGSISVFADIINTNEINTGNGICEKYEKYFEKGESDTVIINGVKMNFQYLGYKEVTEYENTYKVGQWEVDGVENPNNFNKNNEYFAYNSKLHGVTRDFREENYLGFNEFYFNKKDCMGETYNGDTIKGFRIYKGWNLMSIEGIQGINVNDRAYVFNPITKEYILISESSEENRNKIGEWDNKMQTLFKGDEFAGFMIPIWYYSDKDETIVFNKYSRVEKFTESIKYHKPENYITPGWNLININELMIGKRINDFKGNCEIVGHAYWFNPSTQKWDMSRSDGFENELLEDGMLGYGFAVKVKDSCTFDFFGSSQISAPPAIPNN